MPTDLYAAGIGSSVVSPDKIYLADMWLHGPPFLVCRKRDWPKQSFLSRFDYSNDLELEKSQFHRIVFNVLSLI